MENNISKIAEALGKAQSVMSGARKDSKNPFYKSSYASLSSVFESIRIPFAENGLAISQTMDVLENGRTVLKTMLLHCSGQSIDSKMMLPDIADPQKIGSSLSYYRRYSLMAIAGIPTEDDDGNSASRAVDQSYLKNKVKPAKKKAPGIGDIRAKELMDKLQKLPEYLEQIKTFLKNEKIELKDLTNEDAKKIESKIAILSESEFLEEVKALKEAHG